MFWSSKGTGLIIGEIIWGRGAKIEISSRWFSDSIVWFMKTVPDDPPAVDPNGFIRTGLYCLQSFKLYKTQFTECGGLKYKFELWLRRRSIHDWWISWNFPGSRKVSMLYFFVNIVVICSYLANVLKAARRKVMKYTCWFQVLTVSLF